MGPENGRNNNEVSFFHLQDYISKIKLTDNGYIVSLDNKDSTNSNIDFNGYKLYISGKAIN